MAMVKGFQEYIKLQGKGHEVNNYGTMWKVLSQGIHMCNKKALSLLVWKLWPWLTFLKVVQTSRSRSQNQTLWCHVKGLVTRNTYMKYESSILNGWKVMATVKVVVHAAYADADGRAMYRKMSEYRSLPSTHTQNRCFGHNSSLPCWIWIIFHTIVVHDPRVYHDRDPKSYL